MFDVIRSKYFPKEILPHITVHPIASRKELFGEIAHLFDEVFVPFEKLGAFTLPPERQANRIGLHEAFSHIHQEQFIFYKNHQIVGWSYGEMHDSETFFMTNTAILPDYQRRGIYSNFLRHFIDYLATLGYERISSNHQTNNRPVLIAKLKAGFVISGVILDERWSAQVQLTYHIHDDRKRGYEKAFSLEQR